MYVLFGLFNVILPGCVSAVILLPFTEMVSYSIRLVIGYAMAIYFSTI